MLFKMNSTLKRQADRKVKKENSFLYESYSKICLSHLLHFKHWHYVIMLTSSVFFLTQLIDIDVLNFLEISDEDIKTLIESRTTNIVTLISVTFAVIGFLIANLAIKDSYVYNLIFINSRFFSITYFVLTLIACFILLSTLKSQIPTDYVKRIFVTGTYLILLAICCIGYLFTRLIMYTNDKYLHKIIKKDFSLESKKYLIESLRGDFMKGILFNELGFGRYTDYYQNRFIGYTDDKLPANAIVKNIKIEKVKEILSKNLIPYNTVCINMDYEHNLATNQHGFFFILGNNEKHKAIIKKLNECIILEKSTAGLLKIEEIIDYINQKIIEHISKNNHKLVTEFTNMYSEYYELQIKIKRYA